MANSKPKQWYKRWWAITLFIFVGLIFISSLSSRDNKVNTQIEGKTGNISAENTKTDFNAESRLRFDEIKESFPELDNIECFEDDCTNVVYFNFKTIPDDLEFAIRSNTAVFSNFKMKNTGTSHVTIFATNNGKTILQCDGSKGAVDECK